MLKMKPTADCPDQVESYKYAYIKAANSKTIWRQVNNLFTELENPILFYTLHESLCGER